MTFANIPAGAAIFLDANTLVYHFANDPKYGAACTALIKRIEQQQVAGFASSHVQADVAHRLMTIEAMQTQGWPPAGLAARVRKHHSEIAKLSVYQQATASFTALHIQVLPVSQTLIESATHLCKQFELLVGDALVVAIMQAHGLTHLASNDADFDRVQGITRYSPI